MPDNRRRRILVVEDEMMIAMMLEDMLAELGHDVIGPFGRIKAAAEAAGRAAPDAALLDVNLAGREVYPVAEVLAARGIPFTFVTGYDSPGVHEAWRDYPILQKPFHQGNLERALNALLAPA